MDIGVAVGLAVGDVLLGHMALGRDAGVHLRGTQFAVDLLQLLRCRCGLVPDLEGVPLLELRKRERAQRKGDAETAGSIILGRGLPLDIHALIDGAAAQQRGKDQDDRPPVTSLVFHRVKLGLSWER